MNLAFQQQIKQVSWRNQCDDSVCTIWQKTADQNLHLRSRNSQSRNLVHAPTTSPGTPAELHGSICDLQEKFRPAIHEYAKVIATTQKMLKASMSSRKGLSPHCSFSRIPGKILNIPVFATTQQRAKLGETCEELGLDAPDGIATRVHADKSLFSMWYYYPSQMPTVVCKPDPARQDARSPSRAQLASAKAQLVSRAAEVRGRSGGN